MESNAETFDKAKARELAGDSDLIERLRSALNEIRLGKTVSLEELPKAIASRRSSARAAHA
jgi:hypothetical protein